MPIPMFTTNLPRNTTQGGRGGGVSNRPNEEEEEEEPFDPFDNAIRDEVRPRPVRPTINTFTESSVIINNNNNNDDDDDRETQMDFDNRLPGSDRLRPPPEGEREGPIEKEERPPGGVEDVVEVVSTPPVMTGGGVSTETPHRTAGGDTTEGPGTAGQSTTGQSYLDDTTSSVHTSTTTTSTSTVSKLRGDQTPGVSSSASPHPTRLLTLVSLSTLLLTLAL